MFSVDRVNVTISWESSLWMVDEVTQLLSNKNLKETLGKNEVELSKLLEEFFLLYISQLEILVCLRLTTKVLLTKNSYLQRGIPFFSSRLNYL